MDEPAWRAAVIAARDAWPELTLDAAAFVAHAEARRGQGGALPEHLADLFLAWAAGERDGTALRLFEERVLAGVDPVVRGIDAAAAFVDEVKQALRVDLLVGRGDGPARITSYQARGPLLAWVRVAATRVALNLKRAGKHLVADDEVIAELVAREPDPELASLKRRYQAEFAQAVREAIAGLPERARVLLRLHHVEGVRLARIGTLYGVHESTVSRWLQKAAADVLAGAERRMREQLAVSDASFASLARMLASGLDLSISRLLGRGGDA